MTDSPEWFRAPSPDYRTAAFWFWHRIPTRAQIERQLADMRAKGIGIVMIQARPAMTIGDYLSPAYLDAFAYAAQNIRRLGLKLTIYDEYGWMSGHGGGRTVSGADHLRERHLFWTSAVIQQGHTEFSISNIHSSFFDFLGVAGAEWCYEDGEAHWADWTLIASIAHPAEPPSAGKVFDCPVQLEPVGPASCKITLNTGHSIPPGTTVTVFVSARCATSRMINYLLPEAAERFAKLVYEPLLSAAGGVADGFFFDHPYAGFYRWDEHHGDLGNSLLWDDATFEGIDKVSLLALVRDVGKQTQLNRMAFFRVYNDQLHQAFFGTLSQWTADHHVGFTGHELLAHVGGWDLQEGLADIDARTMPGVDYFGLDSFRTSTSVDASGFAPQLSAKMGDSVARANGRSRCMIEQYATGWETGTEGLAGQWGLTAEKFRGQAIRHLLYGARQVLLHALFVTDGIDGDDRLLLNPRFDFPPGYNFQPWWDDCLAIFDELSRLSAFLEGGSPLRPVALFYPLETIRAGKMNPLCGKHFGWWAEALAQGSVGYDVLDESNLATSLELESGYSTLILPAVSEFASSQTIASIIRFAQAGGTVLATGGLAQQLAGLKTVILYDVTGLDDVAAIVSEQPKPAIYSEFEEGSTWQSISRHEDTWRVAAFNDCDKTRRLDVHCDHEIAELISWSPKSGNLTMVPWALQDDTLLLDLEPQTILCLSLRCGVADAPKLDLHERETAIGQTIMLDKGWSLEIDGRAPEPVNVDRGWEVQGHPRFAGTGVYRLTMDLPLAGVGLRWHLSVPGLHETATLEVNGETIGRHVAGAAMFELFVANGPIEIVLSVRNTGANRYYANTPYWDGIPLHSGLTKPPVLTSITKNDSGLEGIQLASKHPSSNQNLAEWE